MKIITVLRSLKSGGAERHGRQNEWRGNVRELHNVLEKVAMLSDKIRLSASDLDGLLPANLRSPPAAADADGKPLTG